MAESTNNQPDAALEKRARDFLAQGRFRKARDEFKLLCKIDRAKYLPELVQANIGLAKEMLAKGQVSEAGQVIAYLKTIASADQLRELNTDIALKSGRPEEGLQGLVETLTSSHPLSEADKIRLVDQVVLVFKDIPAEWEQSAILATEVKAIHHALQAVSLEKWDQVSEILRPLPLNSVFSHWKLFIRGLVQFYRRDFDKAIQVFSKLPAESVPAKASRPFLMIARPASDSTFSLGKISEAQMEALCQLLGQPSLGSPLSQADRLWKEKKYTQSYEVLKKMVPVFPSNSLDSIGVLSDFYFTVPLHLDNDSRFNWMDHFWRMLDRGFFKNPEEKRRAYLQSSLSPLMSSGPEQIEADLRGFLSVHQQLYGNNPRLVSQALHWLANFLIRESPEAQRQYRHYYYVKKQVAHREQVLRLLEESVRLDPDNLSAQLELCEVYGQANKKSERNRQLDSMAARFPDNKAVLLQAGLRCIERKAFQKGLQFFEQAARLDRIDPKIKEAMVEARQKQARQMYQEHRLDKARKILGENETLLVEDPKDFIRARWTNRIFNGVFEFFKGDKSLANQLLDEAENISPTREAFLLHSLLLSKTFPSWIGAKLPYLPELRKLLSQASAKKAALLMRLLEFWSSREDHRVDTWDEEHWLKDYLQNARKHPFTREEVLELVSLTEPQSNEAREVEKLLNKLLKKDSKDPVLRLAKLVVSPPYSLDHKYKKELEEIIQEATRRQEHRCLKEATQMRERIKNPRLPDLPPLPGGPPPFDSEFFDDFPDEWEEAPEVLPYPSPGSHSVFPVLSQQVYEELIRMAPAPARNLMEQLIWEMSQVSEEEMMTRVNTLPNDIPPELSQMLIEMARQMRDGKIKPSKSFQPSAKLPASKPSAPATPSSTSAKPKQAHHSHREDPNQLDLF